MVFELLKSRVRAELTFFLNSTLCFWHSSLLCQLTVPSTFSLLGSIGINIPQFIYTFSHWGAFGLSPVSSVADNAIMNIFELVIKSICARISLGYYRVKLFSKVFAPIYTPQLCVEVLVPHSHQHEVLSGFLVFAKIVGV